jgi:hypothetical protein
VLESINVRVEKTCCKVEYWKNSSQKQRWLASVLNDIEPRLHKVQGYKHLPKLREALMLKLNIKTVDIAVGSNQKAAFFVSTKNRIDSTCILAQEQGCLFIFREQPAAFCAT